MTILRFKVNFFSSHFKEKKITKFGNFYLKRLNFFAFLRLTGIPGGTLISGFLHDFLLSANNFFVKQLIRDTANDSCCVKFNLIHFTKTCKSFSSSRRHTVKLETNFCDFNFFCLSCYSTLHLLFRDISINIF